MPGAMQEVSVDSEGNLSYGAEIDKWKAMESMVAALEGAKDAASYASIAGALTNLVMALLEELAPELMEQLDEILGLGEKLARSSIMALLIKHTDLCPQGLSVTTGAIILVGALILAALGLKIKGGKPKPRPPKKPKKGEGGSEGGDGPKTYETYTKTNPDTGEVYSGRTSGTGTPAENVANRDKGHHMNEKGFGPAKLDKSSSNPDAARGREQHNIDKHGGAKSEGGTSGNPIRGVSRTNKKAEQYDKAARREFGGPR